MAEVRDAAAAGRGAEASGAASGKSAFDMHVGWSTIQVGAPALRPIAHSNPLGLIRRMLPSFGGRKCALFRLCRG